MFFRLGVAGAKSVYVSSCVSSFGEQQAWYLQSLALFHDLTETMEPLMISKNVRFIRDNQ